MNDFLSLNILYGLKMLIKLFMLPKGEGDNQESYFSCVKISWLQNGPKVLKYQDHFNFQKWGFFFISIVKK